LGLLLLAGCTSGPATAGGPVVVTAPRTPFYRYGPAQVQGADFNIFKDTPLTLLKK
jgi:hypothetical protein